MSIKSSNDLVDFYRSNFLEYNDDYKFQFIDDVKCWARVHGLVMGDGQVYFQL